MAEYDTLSNFSFIEDETFGNLEPNMPESSHVISILKEVLFSIAMILNIVVCLCSTGAAIFLIYVIFKFEKIKKQVSVFLIHYAALSCIEYFVMPLINFTFELLHYGLFRWEVICVLYSISGSTCSLVFVFSTALGLFWFIQNFKNNWIQRIPHLQIYVTVLCYLLCGAKFVLDSFECFVEQTLHTRHVLLAMYLTMLVIMISLNIAVRKMQKSSKSEKTKYQFDVASYVVFSYLPLTCVFYFERYFYSNGIADFSILLLHLAQLYAYSGPIVVVYLLGCKNKYFKAAYSRIFKRSFKDYTEDDMNEESENHVAESSQNNGQEFLNDAAYSTVI